MSNLQVQAAVQEIDKSVQEMPRLLVASIDQRALAIGGFHILLGWVERREVRVILPESGAGRADIAQEIVRIPSVQVAQGDRQHDDVAGGLVMVKMSLRTPDFQKSDGNASLLPFALCLLPSDLPYQSE